MGIMIPRFEVEIINSIPGWILIYGRRKTGKTFLIRNYVKFDKYYFVARSGKVYVLEDNSLKLIPRNVFDALIRKELEEAITIVIDEFHRLGEEFMDFLHASKVSSKARLILITSSLFYAEKIVAPRSPLLGIVTPIRVDIIDPRDIISVLSKYFEPKETLEISIFAREPLLLQFLTPGVDANEFYTRMLISIKNIVPALVGEIFVEEDRKLTERYEAIIKAIAIGKTKPSDVASYLSGILSEKLSSHDVKTYMSILTKLGIVKRTKVFNKKYYLYRLASPMIDIHYYLSEKLGYDEMDISTKVLLHELKKKIPLYYEDLIVELLAKVTSTLPHKIMLNEIDAILTKKKKPLFVVEVKFGAPKARDIKKIKDLAKEIKAKPIIVSDEKVEEHGVISLTPEDIIKMAHGEINLLSM